jgi:endonuclease-3
MAKPRTPKGRAVEVARRLAIAYPDAECELDHTNAFELLAATILSAQTTDARVNMVTPEYFRTFEHHLPSELWDACNELVKRLG